MKITKKLAPTLLAASLMLGCASPALACTGVYVGSGLTANGSSYMGRSEDFGTDYVKIFGVSPAADYPADFVYEDTYGFSWPLGGHMYAYTYCKDSPGQGETVMDENGQPVFEAYAEAGQNEKGVCVTATVSTSCNDAVKAADPLVDTGLCEISIPTILLGKCATAKEAVDLMAQIIDEEGSGECNSIMISDPKETWYFEQLSGHQYAAVKLPDDKTSVQPNITLLGVIDVNDAENVVSSAGLVKTAQEGGFLVTDESGKINVAKSYSKLNSGAGQYVRYYQGLFYLDKAAAEALGWSVVPTEEGKVKVVDAKGADLDNSDPDSGLELLIDPAAGKEFTTMDVFKLLAARGEGTDGFNANTDGVYSIGNENQAECHIFETRPGKPTDLATLQWQTMGPAEFTVFLPFYSALLTDVADVYKVDDIEYVDGSMYWTCCKLYELCDQNRAILADGVTAYFTAYQESLIQQQEAADKVMDALYALSPVDAAKAATQAGKDNAQQLYDATAALLAEAEAYLASGKTEPFVPTTDLMPTYTLPASGAACASTQTVTVDGKAVELQMYALKDEKGSDTNYVKVRDVAAALNGTKAQFNVDWAENTVLLQTGAAYTTPNGQENKTPYTGDQTYTLPAEGAKVNGADAALNAFVLTDAEGKGSTYYQLRDLGKALGFNVGWSADAGVFVETDKPYDVNN